MGRGLGIRFEAAFANQPPSVCLRVFLRMHVHLAWQGGTPMNASICRQVLTQILIAIISWRWDLGCFNFFFEFLVLFKYFT